MHLTIGIYTRKWLDLVRRVISRAAECAFDEEMWSRFQRDVTDDHPRPLNGHFAAVESVDAIGLETLVERRPSLLPRVQVSNGRASIFFGGNVLSGPTAIAEALSFVANRGQFAVGELPDTLADSSKLVLARRLIREGFLSPVHHPETTHQIGHEQRQIA